MIIDDHNQKAIELFLDTADPAGTSGFWIGLTDLLVEGNFVWTNGDKATYRNWLPDQPNNHQQVEHFAHIWTKATQRRWDDEENEKPTYFALCQFMLH